MLDDLKMIHQRDAQDSLGHAEKQWQVLGYPTYTLPTTFNTDDIYNIVFIGVGSCATGAAIARQWLYVGEPFEIVRNYMLPPYVDKDTLCVVACLDGDDVELMATIDRADALGARLIMIALEGDAADMVYARQAIQPDRFAVCIVPSLLPGGRPVVEQSACLTVIKALTDICAACGLLKDPSGNQRELAEQTTWLSKQLAAWRPDVPASSNAAKQIALELLGKSVVVYGGPLLATASYYWKTSINRYAKQVAWSSEYPDCNFNDLVGWSKQPIHKPYAVVEFHSTLERDHIQKSFAATQKVLSGLRPVPTVVSPVGDTLLQQLLYLVTFGDFVAIYLGLLNGVNPASLELVGKFKKELV
jgi:hypothetical protein